MQVDLDTPRSGKVGSSQGDSIIHTIGFHITVPSCGVRRKEVREEFPGCFRNYSMLLFTAGTRIHPNHKQIRVRIIKPVFHHRAPRIEQIKIVTNLMIINSRPRPLADER
jgi:hypothetical protein